MKSLKVRFLLVFVLVAVLPLLAVSSYMYLGARRISTSSANENLQAVSVARVDLVNAVITTHMALVEQVASGADIISDLDTYNKTGVLRTPPTEGAAQRALAVSLRNKRNPALADMKAISVSDKNGKIVASSDASLIGRTQPFSPDVEFNQPADGSAASLTLRRPILLDNGTRVGEIEFTSFGRSDLHRISTSPNGVKSTVGVRYVQLVDNTVQSSTPRIKNNNVDLSAVVYPLSQAKNQHGIAGDYFYNLRDISGTHSGVLISVATSDVFAAADTMRNVAAFFALLISGLGFLVYWYYNRLRRVVLQS